MACKITIDSERCKGCGLCVELCPKNSISISKTSNQYGYFPAQADSSNCSGCCACGLVCPEACLRIVRQSSITELKPKKTVEPTLVKEKR